MSSYLPVSSVSIRTEQNHRWTILQCGAIVYLYDSYMVKGLFGAREAYRARCLRLQIVGKREPHEIELRVRAARSGSPGDDHLPTPLLAFKRC